MARGLKAEFAERLDTVAQGWEYQYCTRTEIASAFANNPTSEKGARAVLRAKALPRLITIGLAFSEALRVCSQHDEVQTTSQAVPSTLPDPLLQVRPGSRK